MVDLVTGFNMIESGGGGEVYSFRIFYLVAFYLCLIGAHLGCSSSQLFSSGYCHGVRMLSPFVFFLFFKLV